MCTHTYTHLEEPFICSYVYTYIPHTYLVEETVIGSYLYTYIPHTYLLEEPSIYSYLWFLLFWTYIWVFELLLSLFCALVSSTCGFCNFVFEFWNLSFVFLDFYFWFSTFAFCILQIYIYVCNTSAAPYPWKATPEDRKEAQEALTKYDMLSDDESRRRFRNRGLDKNPMWGFAFPPSHLYRRHT